MVAYDTLTGIQAIIGDPVSLAVSVVGFGERWSTAFGHYTYIDGLSTLKTASSNGFSGQLMRW
jgi:hypothetical protein